MRLVSTRKCDRTRVHHACGGRAGAVNLGGITRQNVNLHKIGVAVVGRTQQRMRVGGNRWYGQRHLLHAAGLSHGEGLAGSGSLVDRRATP